MNASPTTIRGNAARDAELTTLASGTAKATFAVAVPHRYQRNGEWQEDASFINIVVWGWMAEEAARVVTKGVPLIVMGRLQHRSYEVDGERRYATEIIADDVAVSVRGIQSFDRKTRDSVSAGATSNVTQESLPDDAW